MAHQVPAPVAERIQYFDDGAPHGFNAEVVQPGTSRGITPSGQVNEDAVNVRRPVHQGLERGPGSSGAVQVNLGRSRITRSSGTVPVPC